MAAPKTRLHLRHTGDRAGRMPVSSNLIVGMAIFAAGLISGISTAPLLFPAPAAPAAAPAPAVPPTAARPETPGIERRYQGIVAGKTADGLLLAMPDLPTKNGKTAMVAVVVTPSTLLNALVPNVAETPARTVPLKDGEPPPPLPPQKDPYKEEPRTIADFKADDVVDFVTTDDPAAGKGVIAVSVTWIAALPQGGGQGGPTGDGGAAPLPPK